MRLVIFLVIVSLLGGCVTTPAPTPPPRKTTTRVFPELAIPPPVEEYITTLDKAAIRQYYSILVNYYAYLGSYLDFVAHQFEFNDNPNNKQCLRALYQARINLSSLPTLVGRSDDNVIDALIDHLEKIRIEVREYNAKVDKNNREIEKACF